MVVAGMSKNTLEDMEYAWTDPNPTVMGMAQMQSLAVGRRDAHGDFDYILLLLVLVKLSAKSSEFHLSIRSQLPHPPKSATCLDIVPSPLLVVA